MAFTERVRTGAGQQIEELDTAVAADAVRPEVVVRNAAGGAVGSVLKVGLTRHDGALPGVTSMATDGLATGANELGLSSSPGLVFNGTTWDRLRSNMEPAIALPSAVRAATTATADLVNYNWRGCLVFLDVTANPGGGETLTVEIQTRDPVSGTYKTITAFAASFVAANGHEVLTVYPGAAETAATAGHQVQALTLPRTFRVRVVHSAAGNWTYSVGLAVTL